MTITLVKKKQQDKYGKCAFTLLFVSASYWGDLQKVSPQGCRMPAGPVSSPSRSDTLGSPPPARLTGTGQIPGQLRSPSNEWAQSDAAAANTKRQRMQKGMKKTEVVSAVQVILLKAQNLDVCKMGSIVFYLPVGESRGNGWYPAVLGADCWSVQWHPGSVPSRSSLWS